MEATAVGNSQEAGEGSAADGAAAGTAGPSLPPTMPWPRAARDWGLALAVAVVYLGAAKLGLSMAFLAEQVSPVWPATGIALAAVLLLGPRVWPGIAAGALIANATAHEPLAVAAGIAAGNTVEALLGAWLLRRVGAFRTALAGVREALGLTLAALASTALCATIGVGSLCLGGVEPWSRFEALWQVWWLGDAMGALVMAPLLLSWLGSERSPWPLHRAGELAAVAVAAMVVCALIFTRPVGLGTVPGPTLEYGLFPFLVWAALRAGARGASLVTFATSTVAIVSTLAGTGPFAARPLHDSLVLLQTYLGVVALTGLFLAAAIAERDRAEGGRAAAARQAEERLRSEAAFRRRTEEELRESELELRRRAEALAEADRRKDEFLAMLGHELRNPLGAVSNALAVLRAGDEATSGRAMLDVIQRQVHHLGRLVGDLLEVSRITRGEISLRKEALDLRAVVVRAMETAQPWIDERGHRLTVERPPQALTLEGDPMRLEQVFANLLHNAAKYTKPGGSIVVVVDREGESALVRVRDDGIGIPADLLPRVFELFTQGDRSLDRARGGLGIGLTLVQRIVELHEGSVEARSDGIGRGCEMVVRLPLPLRAAASRPSAVPVEATGEGKWDRLRVLIVEDQADAAASLAELLQLWGYAVEVAPDGAAACAAAAVRCPDVVLLDIGLPGLDGYAVAGRLRRLAGCGDALIVALSGYGGEEELQRSRAAGIDHHLVKPLDVDALDRLLARAGRVGARRHDDAPTPLPS